MRKISNGHCFFSMIWEILRQYKGTECNEMRKFLLNVIVVTRPKRNKEQTALMDYGNHFPNPTTRCFFCDSHWKLTNSTDIENIAIESEVFDQTLLVLTAK